MDRGVPMTKPAHPDLGDPETTWVMDHMHAKAEAEKKQREHDAKYPEHVKLRKVAFESRIVGEFLDWLADKNIFLCTVSPGRNFHTYEPTNMCTKELLAKYFEIDTWKLEDEKCTMIDEQRALNEKAEKEKTK